MKNPLQKTTKMNENSKQARNNSKRDDKLKSFIERLERLLVLNNINFDIKEVFSEAKASECNTTIMREILAPRIMEIDEKLEQKILLKTFNTVGIC